MRTGPVMNVIGGSAAAAILIGVRLNRPRMAIAWYLFCGGLCCSSPATSSRTTTALLRRGGAIPLDRRRTVPRRLPFLIAGLIILVRSRNPGRDRAALIDALVITIGVGVLSWVFLMAPNATNTDFTLQPEADLDRLPAGRPAPGRHDRSSGGRARKPNARLLPAGRQRGGAAADRLEVRLHPGHQHLQRVGERTGLRLAALLPAVGRRRAAPLDAVALRARRREASTVCSARASCCCRPPR